MITTLLSLIGGGLGGVLRFVPEILKLITAKQDRAHEYKMTQLQLEIDKARATQQIDLTHAQAAIAEGAGQMAAWADALKAQSTPTGIGWADALSASVRPVVTYWWLSLFTGYKVATVVSICLDWAGWPEFIRVIWTDQDAGILSMILGFWFVDRSIRRGKQ